MAAYRQVYGFGHLLTAWEWDQLQNPTFVLSMGPLPLPNARYCQSLGIFGARFFTGRMPVLSPNQHHQSVAEGSEKIAQIITNAM